MKNWRENYESICSAPLVVVTAADLDSAHPAIDFLDYWKSLNDGEVPDRGQFKPQSIPSLLRWLMMFRREAQIDEDRHLLYLQGNSAAELTDGLQQGKYLDEFTELACFATRRAILRGVVETGQPAFAVIAIGAKKTDFIADVGVGAFPFYSEASEPEIVMVPAPVSLKLRRYL